jgi:cytochrome P450
LAKKYGTFFKIHEIFNRPAIVVSDAKLIQEITLNNVYDYRKRLLGDIVRFLGDGLVTAEGENHKRQRKMMNPAFAHSIIKVINYILFVEL